jgi:hypothetical protein
MNDESHDDLWKLLGQAKKPSVSPFFSRNVLRTIREEPQERGLWAWAQSLLRRAPVHSAALAALVSFGSFSLWQENQQRGQMAAMAHALSSSPDYAVISQLDELLAFEENSVWLDKSAD